MRITSRIWLIGLLAATAACTVKDVTAPPLAGPSELGLRLAMTAIPDSILQDGASQTSITIEATGADNRPVRGLAIRLEMAVNGVFQDFGLLSAKSVVTGDDGKARVTYTAPPRPAEPVDLGTIVTIFATPSGNDFRGAYSRQIDIRLVTPGVILPPNDAPIADFSFSPTSPAAGATVTFDASLTTDDGVQCGTRCTYTWDFGDGTNGSGIFATHQYRIVGSFQVKLTAIDSRGASSTAAKTVNVGAGTAPTATFTFSPSNPAISQPIFFNAEASRAGPGRTIVSYKWDFGSGRTAEGVSVTKGYDVAGTYTVTLTVTDDIGQQGTTQQSVTVGASGTGPVADLVISPPNGTTNTIFFFDASGSTPGPDSTIVQYRFLYADGSPEDRTTSPTRTYKYSTPGSYTVRLTVVDSAGRTATKTVTLSVTAPAP